MCHGLRDTVDTSVHLGPRRKRDWGDGVDKGPEHRRVLANALQTQSEREVRAILETE